MKGKQFKALSNFTGKAVTQHKKHNGEELSRAKANEAKLKRKRRRIAKQTKMKQR